MDSVQNTSDTTERLLNAARDPEIFMLVGGPVALLVLVAVVFALVIFLKRRQEAKLLEPEMRLPKAGVRVPEAAEEVPAPSAPAEVQEVRGLDQTGWLNRLTRGLSKTRDYFQNNLAELFNTKGPLSEAVLEKVHEVLYRADIGIATADHMVAVLRRQLSTTDGHSWETAKEFMREEASQLLTKNSKPLNTPATSPMVILIVGVNGVGKTTTIAKLAATFLAADKTVLLCAADTYRAAAIDQLKVWGERLGVDVVAQQQGSDPAAVAFDSVKAAIARKTDVLLIDTAGRLHSKKELMDELNKINRVIGRDLPGAPHETWLVIDATTGQNAIQQVKAFREVVNLTGLVVTKLDGTAKGGVLIGAATQFDLPIRYIGVGEKAADLREFNARDFASSLFS